MILLTAAVALATAFSTETDTTFAVTKGTRLELTNYGGSITATAWNKDQIRIEAEHSGRTTIEIAKSGTSIEVEAQHWRGAPSSVDYTISLPVWMAVELSGVYTDITVTGTRADVSCETVQGEVKVEGGEGYVKLASIEGAVSVARAKGKIELSGVNEDINVVDVEGDILADGVNGGVYIYGARSGSCEASTVNSDVVYDGEIRADGRYRFATHSGDIGLGVPEKADATISVSTFSGSFEASFPLSISESKRSKRFRFKLGEGGALVDLESFQGTVYLVRPGDAILERSDHDPSMKGEEKASAGHAKGHKADKDQDKDKDQDEDK